MLKQEKGAGPSSYYMFGKETRKFYYKLLKNDQDFVKHYRNNVVDCDNIFNLKVIATPI